MEIFVIIWMFCAFFAYIVAKDRAPSKTGLAAALGFFLGPIGVVITFFMRDSWSIRPKSRIKINPESIVYQYYKSHAIERDKDGKFWVGDRVFDNPNQAEQYIDEK